MEAMIIGDTVERRQAPVPVGGEVSGFAPIIASTVAGGGSTIVFASGTPSLTPTPTPTPSTVVNTVTASSTATPTPTAAPSSSPGSNTAILIGVLVPVCVLLAAIPTAAYLCYLRRRDRRNREMEAQILRERVAPSGASAHTGEALLMRRSGSHTSHREPKYPSVSSEDFDMASMEKGPRQPEIRDSASIFAPPQHGFGKKGPPGIDTSMKPGVPVRPVATQSPTLPPLNFGKDSFSQQNTTASPPKPTVPATLPTFAPTQPKRAPNPALAPAGARSNTNSPAPAIERSSPPSSLMDNPNWPLPATARDSASVYSAAGTVPAVGNNKPLPAGISREVAPNEASANSRRPSRSKQAGPRESSIAYGMPPIPPSPQQEHSSGDRRSGASRKRDSDAVSELSYSMSVRGKRDTRRDTDAISIISAMSDKDR